MPVFSKARDYKITYKRKEVAEVDPKVEWSFEKNKKAQTILQPSRRKLYRWPIYKQVMRESIGTKIESASV